VYQLNEDEGRRARGLYFRRTENIAMKSYLLLLGSLLVMAFRASAQSLPEGEGKDLVAVICSSCHSTERIVAKRMTRAQWQDKVLEMLQEETDVTQAERDRIVNYLSKSFPPGVNVNTAAAKDIETGLELSTENAVAIVRYREQNGTFKTIDDVKKVPGVDAAKIEAKKDRLEF
jgi:competence protein ComEA